MPIYEYQCDACGKRSELLQKLSDPPAETCPECGEAGLRRVVSAAAFHLKGGGWYETDFKKRPNQSGDKADSGKGNASEKKSADSKSDGAKDNTRTSKNDGKATN